MLLEIENLSLTIETMRGKMNAIRNISFQLDKNETLGIVGESGCGKSLTGLALMGLLPSTIKLRADKMHFAGIDLLTAPTAVRRHLRGRSVSMIFQDPMSSLNPSLTVGYQLMESLKIEGESKSKSQLIKEATQLLERVGLPEASSRLRAFPHQLSGGMCQRVMIAICLAAKPKLLIADEPTTALDVTIQAQILSLLKELQAETQMALMLITHDLGVVAKMAQRIQVMYAGEIVETAGVNEIITAPHHPYTEGLLRALPGNMPENAHRSQLSSIGGMVPDLLQRPTGCQLHPRCAYKQAKCLQENPLLLPNGVEKSNLTRCHFPLRTS